MKRLKIVAIIAMCLLFISVLIYGNSSTIAENAGDRAVHENDGSLATVVVERVVENTKESIDRLASILALLGIGGIFITTSKWIENENSSDSKEKGGE